MALLYIKEGLTAHPLEVQLSATKEKETTSAPP